MLECVFITFTCWQVCSYQGTALSYSQKLDARQCREQKMEVEREKRRQELEQQIELEKLRKENNEFTK